MENCIKDQSLHDIIVDLIQYTPNLCSSELQCSLQRLASVRIANPKRANICPIGHNLVCPGWTLGVLASITVKSRYASSL
jgi:hypothetical protein